MTTTGKGKRPRHTAKLPPSTGARRETPVLVPAIPVALTAFYVEPRAPWRVPLFRAEHIPEVEKASGFRLLSSISNDKAADILTRCFVEAIEDEIRAKERPTPTELHDYFRGIAQALRATIRSLGYDLDAIDAQVASAATPSADAIRRHLSNAICAAEPPLVTALEELARWLNGSKQFRSLLAGRHRTVRHQFTGQHREPELDVATRYALSDAALYMLPDILRVALMAARNGAAIAARQRTKIGRRPNQFIDTLLRELAQAHREMFGANPKTQDSTRTRCGPAVEWLRKVVQIAMENVPYVVAENGDAIRAELDRLVHRQDAVLAQHLEGLAPKRRKNAALGDVKRQQQKSREAR